MTQSRQTTLRWTSPAVLITEILLLEVLICGCATVFKGSPNQPTYQAVTVKTLVQKYSKPDAISTDPEKLTADQRNRVIEDLIFLIDVNYHQFEDDLYKGRASFDTVTDLLIIGLGAAGSLVDASGTQAILAAISGGIGGSRVSINKNFFREQSTNALISTMRATRKAKLKMMLDAETLSLSDYPMSRVLLDITEYYNAGTIIGAFESIVAEAGQKERTAANAIEKKVQDKVDLQFKTSAPRDRIKNWLLKDPTKNVGEFEKWLQAKKVALTPIFWVYDAGTNEKDLLDAISHFKIPE
jgi:hypothetical protein